MKILSCLKENEELEGEERRATQMSGIVVKASGHWIALYANAQRRIHTHKSRVSDELSGQASAG